MKIAFAIIILIFFSNCSFDNKTGIWNSTTVSDKKNTTTFKDFKTLSQSNISFEEIISLEKNYKFQIPGSVQNNQWQDIFYNERNNLVNFSYKNSNKLIFKSKKVTRHVLNGKFLSENNNIITTDDKGNILVLSIDSNKIISKFNFYKNRFKKIKKNLNLIIEENIIYISDNIGYLYAFNYEANKILWAKNYKVPFRSNLKISKNKLIAANQNNDLYFFNKKNGETINFIPTEENIIKNEFVNNIAINKENTFFLNTYGSLYSIDNDSNRINWFINLNQSQDLNPSNLFKGSNLINYDKKIIVSSNDFTYVIDENNGSILHKKNFTSQVKPIVINNLLFLVTSMSYLTVTDLKNGKILYSYNINQKIADFLNVKRKNVQIQNIMMLNNKIFIFLKNSYTLIFNVNGDLKGVKKLPSKLKSNPIIIKESLIFLDQKNRISIIN